MVSLTSQPNHNLIEQNRFSCRVYYQDTDAGGVVYHAAYLNFAERARTEWLRSLGTNHQKLLAQKMFGYFALFFIL